MIKLRFGAVFPADRNGCCKRSLQGLRGRGRAPPHPLSAWDSLCAGFPRLVVEADFSAPSVTKGPDAAFIYRCIFFFDDVEKVEWPRGARDPPRSHLPARPMGRGTRWLPCVGSPLLAPSRAVHEACAAPQHCSSPVYQVGTNESLVPRPSVLTGDPGEGEAQMAPPMHCVPCALQTPGAGLPGEAEPPACGPRWRWNVSCSGRRPGGRGPGWRRT